MSALTLTYTATANTVAPSAQYNLNNSEIVTWSTTIDHSNTVNSTGFYASQILPTTAAQATFGLTATGVGYKFLANDATATPLTVSGVSGQSADLFDVTLTSGGTKAFSITSAGAAFLLSTAQFANSSNTLDYGVTNAARFTFQTAATNTGVVVALGNFAASVTATYSPPAGGSGAGTINGFLISNISGGTSGGVIMGGSTKTAQMTYNNNHTNAVEFQDTATAGYTPIFAGAYTNASDAAFKSNIAPLSTATPLIMALKPSTYTLTKPGTPGIGFIAQDVQQVLPVLVSANEKTGMLGVNYDGIIPVLVKAFQEEVAVRQQMQNALHAAGVAGF